MRSLWLLLVYASNLLPALRTEERERVLSGNRDADLVDVIADVLVTEVERRLRNNLTPDYRPRAAELTRVRGSIDHLRTSTNRLMDRGRIACRFDELTVDTPRNQFVCTALRWSGRVVQSATLADRCTAAAFRMQRMGVSDRAPTRAEISKDRLGHHDQADRRVIDAAALILDMAVPTHLSGGRSVPVLAQDEDRLRTLFEKAVNGYFTYSLDRADWTVSRPHLDWGASGESAALELLPRLETDTVLDERATGRRIIVETKFTSAIKPNRFGTRKIRPNYMFQLYAYVTSQARRRPESAGPVEGVLLFALTEGQDPVDIEYTIDSHRFRVLSVDLVGSPADIRAQWDRCWH
ncbi:5-methylcytosine restriction system specificity protein McrC [Rhodococcus sp. (in: high G+C Gram-positive bacteria)]|uniref:5-methylcytosine restriction system specificity protein McrC n=1 Tax=Rhodococcus sp. TaxID=1831 RepID=UPI003B8A75C4